MGGQDLVTDFLDFSDCMEHPKPNYIFHTCMLERSRCNSLQKKYFVI